MASQVKHGLKPLRLISDISKELRKATSKSPRTSIALKHVMEQTRKNQVTGEQICRAESELYRTADAFRVYLESSRRRDAIQNEFSGKEKTTEEAANIVGLTTPERYQAPLDKS